MQYFNTSIEQMIRDYVGDFAADFDMGAIVHDYMDAFNAELQRDGGMCSLHEDGSITEWDWADMPGWNERTPLTDDWLEAVASSIDIATIVERHDTTVSAA